MPVTPHPNESPAYRKQRAELLEAEIALKDQIERVSALRRSLLLDTIVEDPASRTQPARNSPAPPYSASAQMGAHAISIR